MCAACYRHSIPIESEAWWTTCKSCYKKGEIQEAPLVLLEGRKCNMCNKITIKLEEPHWMKTCTFCYKNRNLHLHLQQKNLKRECVSNVKRQI